MAQDSQDGQHQILGSQPPGQADQHQPPGQGGERQSPGRLRRKQNIRRLVSEHAWSVDDLVMPLFVADQTPPRIPVASIPGMDYLNIAGLLDECKTLTQLQIPGIALFPRIRATLKNKRASEATNPANMYLAAIRAVKQHYPDLIVFSDVALDPYHADGHDGIMQDAGANANTNTNVNLPATLTALAEMALLQAKAGADFVAPSDMFDGRIGYIRAALDQNGHCETGILSYAVKYASALYQPFREALASHPVGHKRGYQMNPANIREAQREAQLDCIEAADILMIKPALSYLDVVARIRQNSQLPLAAYHVSGEYAMLYWAKQNGQIDSIEHILNEQMLCLKRAGVDMIFTYAAKTLAKMRSASATAAPSEFI